MDVKDDRRLPYWPAALNKGTAAAYCGMSYDFFSRFCPVKPIAFTDSARGQRYLRQRLDEWLFALDPNEPIDARSAKRTDDELESWESWEHSPRKNAEPRTGAGGYPIVDDPRDPVKKWYDSLGFDPETMGQEDMSRLMAKAHEEWAATIPGSKLGKREIKALKFLAAIGPNIKVHWRDVKDCGPDTEDRLKIRGFLKTFSQEKYPDRIGYYMLTDAGLEAFNEIC
ncbi:hypothetical protein [Rhizobium sp. BK377]|uniref:hypothetical protein n=1 Tax=Rhizobium sp. BK377 TaxID=2587058 RepID=UPI0017E486B3|nr:hypothetical protein [Rhizobium sp. BK377]MBB3465271.1 hypothetical protein [Rhizobium sp. BK377]